MKFLTTYKTRPFHILGGTGLAFGAVGGALLTWMLVDFFRGIRVGGRPALSAGVLLVLVGVQLAATGLIAELVVSRTRARETSPARGLRIAWLRRGRARSHADGRAFCRVGRTHADSERRGRNFLSRSRQAHHEVGQQPDREDL